MDRDTVIALAAQAGIIPWVKHEWSKDRFVHADEGMDGDAACLLQFAELIAAHEREACAKLADEEANDLTISEHWSDCGEYIAAAIRSRT